MAKPALLVQETEFRVMLLQALQRFERIRYQAQTSLIRGSKVKKISLLSCARQQRFGGHKRFRVPAEFAELAYAAYLSLDRRVSGCARHGDQLYGGIFQTRKLSHSVIVPSSACDSFPLT
jgi:hypothetical protein